MNVELSPGTVVGRNEAVLHRRLLDGLLLLVPGSSEPLKISSPGEVLWALLEPPMRVGDLVVDLAEIYSAPSATVRSDVESILDELRAIGAIVVEAP